MKLSTNKKYTGAFSARPDIYHPLLVDYSCATKLARKYKDMGLNASNIDAHRAYYREAKAKEAWEAAGCPIFKNEK